MRAEVNEHERVNARLIPALVDKPLNSLSAKRL